MAGLESLGVQLKPRVAIVGGGCAGLAAAAQLAESGLPVTLYEASKQLGGRARGLNWNGKRLDNGQHILLGAYAETLRLLGMAGVDHDRAFLRLPLQLIQHGKFELRASPGLPAPLHIVAGLLRAHGPAIGEKLATLRFMTTLRWSGFRLSKDEPLDHFLARYRQPKNLIDWLWEPLCLAALNTPLHQASTQVFLNVLRDSFTGSRAGSDLLLPRADLSSLIAEPLAEHARRVGSTFHLGCAVHKIRPYQTGFCLTTQDHEAEFSHVIVATPPFRASELLDAVPGLDEIRTSLAAMAYQPIYTVYLHYPGHVRLPHPMIGMTGGMAQWVIDRGQLDGQHGLISVVISACGRHQEIPQNVLAETIAQELRDTFPALPQPAWHKVIAEKRATFTCHPAMHRPDQVTRFPGLYLAGDYTAGDYPATIEGAVRSGVKCARLILESL